MSSGERQADLDELVTEGRRAAPSEYDLLSTVELVELMNREDAAVPAAVLAAGEKLAAAVDAIVERLRGGGRLVYVGAGTSGRLAALDAAECASTFSTEVFALVAPSDAAEDDVDAGRAGIDAIDVTAVDAVVGVSASGTTPYTVA